MRISSATSLSMASRRMRNPSPFPGQAGVRQFGLELLLKGGDLSGHSLGQFEVEGRHRPPDARAMQHFANSRVLLLHLLNQGGSKHLLKVDLTLNRLAKLLRYEERYQRGLRLSSSEPREPGSPLLKPPLLNRGDRI